jgi:bifunctional DNA-binding transcriptional regulator/antitoxin component of YhaV-PrlF toxin-antitoxin module
MSYQGYVTVQSRGVISLPAVLRRRYLLEQPGAQVEITEREDGVLEMRPAIAVPSSQAWFWEDSWQRREREVDAYVADGQTTRLDSAEQLLATIDELTAQQ